jgi:hypothetical protein
VWHWSLAQVSIYGFGTLGGHAHAFLDLDLGDSDGRALGFVWIAPKASSHLKNLLHFIAEMVDHLQKALDGFQQLHNLHSSVRPKSCRAPGWPKEN